MKPFRHTRIKFCGMTRVEDARAAASLGVDAIGVILTSKSKRYAGIERARAIRQALPPFITLVTLFLDDAPGFIAEAVAAVQPDLLQFHGSERAEECARYGVPYLKSIAMADAGEPRRTFDRHPAAVGFLLDAHASGEVGGSGKTFDWSQASAASERPIVLAGGLAADNVGVAIRMLRPYAVDVASGVEVTPGIKDGDKMRAFVAAVRLADGG